MQQQKEQARVTCRGCGETVTVDAPEGRAKKPDAGLMQQGWSFQGQDAYCPVCAAERERQESGSAPPE